MGVCYSMYNQRRQRNKLIRVDPEDCEKRTFQGVTRLAKLTDIYDGDTFTIITNLCDGEKLYKYSIRLYGIDTPELKPRYCTADRELHIRAAKHVRDLLKDSYPVGTMFYVDFEKEEKYGRVMGTIWTAHQGMFGIGGWKKGKNICQWLIDNKYALSYGGATKGEFTKSFLEAIVGQRS